MRRPFDDLLDEITEARNADDMLLEPRVARLERIVQTLLLALVEAEEPEDDAIVEILPPEKTR